MNKKLALGLTLMAALSISGMVQAASPLPQFEKEAIEDTHRRTGDRQTKIEDHHDGLSEQHLGNTGTAENPAFYVEKIELNGLPCEDDHGYLKSIIKKYEKKDLDIASLRKLQQEVTDFVHHNGYTVSQAVIPPQEVKDGVLKIDIYVGRYDKISLTKNTSKIADRVLDKYIHQIKEGDIIEDVILERSLNRMNDLPGAQTKAVLKPGSKRGTTSVEMETTRRPVWNNYVFTDNAGSKSTGRYRYGFYSEYNNPGHNGDKIGVSGLTSNGDLRGGTLKYEAPVGYKGTRMGVVLSLTDYDSIDHNYGGMWDSKGRSMGASYYGFSPVYRDKRHRMHLVWGFDHRKLKDEYTGQFRKQVESVNRILVDGGYDPILANGYMQNNRRHSNVWHTGINGSEHEKNRFSNYNLIWWWGNATVEHMWNGSKTSPTEGTFHKGTLDANHIIFDGKTNYRFNFSGQIANRNLDSSESFYIGGINSVRAYKGSTFAGDNGYYWCTEIRRNFGIKDLEAAIFLEGAEAHVKGAAGQNRTLLGWGVGLRYNKDNDWHMQLDYGRKIKPETDEASLKDDKSLGRWWYQVYKMY